MNRKSKEFLRYLDLFGTKCTFYTEQKIKLYTPLGGLLSIISTLAGIFVFIYFNLSSFKGEDPLVVTSRILEEQHEIKFNEEKIWIPWKISYYNSDNFFNHSDILFPIINYYYKENNTGKIEKKILSYRLCNETSMVNRPDNIFIESSLEELYCIDMDELLMGGELYSSDYNYVEFNLYGCKQGIKYDVNNSHCKFYNQNLNSPNYLQLILYYPSIQFEQTDFNTPLKINYIKSCALLSESLEKIEELVFQKIVLYDKYGFLTSKRRIYNFWEGNNVNRDIYFKQNKNNISSKLYTFKIIIGSNTIYYYRSYKNIFSILSQSLPLIYLVANIFKLIAKVFKLSSINRKMTELLFENLTEKRNKFVNYEDDLKSKKNLRNLKTNNNNSNTDENIINVTNDNSRIPHHFKQYPSFSLFKKKNSDNQLVKNSENNKNNYPVANHRAISENPRNFNLRVNSINLNKLTIYKKLSLKFDELAFPKKKRFIANKLFPFRYYFCSIFVKNIDLTKYRFGMSRKFVKVYCFLCQLFDVSSYFLLQKEFSLIKNALFDEHNLKLIESNTKINVNSQSFMRDMNNCNEKNRFNILGKNQINKNAKSKLEIYNSK